MIGPDSGAAGDELAGDGSPDDASVDAPIDELIAEVDAELLGQLSAAFDDELSPVPPALLRFAGAAGRWMALDEELAALEYDSAIDVAVGARSAATARRTVRFRGAGIVVTMSIDAHALVVLVEPGARYTGRLTGPGRELAVETDDEGQLSVAEWPAPVRVELDLPDGRFVSPWVIG